MKEQHSRTGSVPEWGASQGGVGSFSKLYTLISLGSYSFNRGGPLFNILGEVTSLGNWLEKQSQVPAPRSCPSQNLFE